MIDSTRTLHAAKVVGVFLAVCLFVTLGIHSSLANVNLSLSEEESFHNNHHDDDSTSLMIKDALDDEGTEEEEVVVDSSLSSPSLGLLLEGETIAATSAFDRDLYRTVLTEPYRSQNPCQPRGIHLSQFDNVHKNNNDKSNNNDHRVSVTVSFMLDSHEPKCQSAVLAAVIYGRRRRDGTDENPEGMQLATAPPVHFSYTSDKSHGLFTSDWIHHVTIPQLEAGMQRYWYRVIVLLAAHDADEEENIINNNNNKAVDYNPHRSSVATFQSADTPGTSSSTTRRLMTHSLRGGDASITKNKIIDSLQQQQQGELLLGESENYHFWTPPLPGNPTTLALVGDLGQTKDSTKTMSHILKGTIHGESCCTKQPPVSNLLIAGDLSYADSDPYRWKSWFWRMEPLLRSTLLSTAAGNHEIETDQSTHHDFVPYKAYFRNPNRRVENEDPNDIIQHHHHHHPNGDYNYGNSFYSYQHGLAHIIVLNSYTNTSVGSVQYKWLEQELQQYYAANRHSNPQQRHPWLIVSFHSPLYTTFLGHVHEDQARQMKLAMEPLFVKYGVNLVISGHDHGYMRTHSVRPGPSTTTTVKHSDDDDDDSCDYDDEMDNAQVDPTGKSPIYLTLGSAGNREHHSPGYRNPNDIEEWVAVRDICDYGYGHLFLANATHARLHWIRDGVVPQNMTITDNVWLLNHHHDQRDARHVENRLGRDRYTVELS